MAYRPYREPRPDIGLTISVHVYLETGAVVCELADAVKDEVDNLLADGVVAAGEVVGSIFLTGS